MYSYTIKGHYRVKATKVYPWPCASEPARVLELLDDDVLTKSDDGTYMKHTGLGTFGHVIPDDDVEFVPDEASLTVRGMFSGE